jgi:hypothetical protein
MVLLVGSNIIAYIGIDIGIDIDIDKVAVIGDSSPGLASQLWMARNQLHSNQEK